MADVPAGPAPGQTLIDPDCRDGKHTSCVGPPCECDCHAMCGCHEPPRPMIAHMMPAGPAPGNPVPAEAIAAAVAAWHEANRAARMPTTASGFEDRFVSKLLAAAAPHITARATAAERERWQQRIAEIRQNVHDSTAFGRPYAMKMLDDILADLLAATPGDTP